MTSFDDRLFKLVQLKTPVSKLNVIVYVTSFDCDDGLLVAVPVKRYNVKCHFRTFVNTFVLEKQSIVANLLKSSRVELEKLAVTMGDTGSVCDATSA